MYRLKLGVPVQAIRFTGINFMEIYTLVPDAIYFSAHPNKKMTVSFWHGRDSHRNIENIEVHTTDWLVVDEAGPMVVTDSAFHARYERVPE